jgi:hypothetical protein
MRSKTAGYSATLTNYARGLSQDLSNPITRFLAPEVVVTTAIGQYKSFDDKGNFKAVDTARAVGGKARRLTLNADDPAYLATPNALEIPLDQYEGELAGDRLTAVRQAKTKVLVSTAMVSREAKVINIARSVAAESGVGNWSDDTVDPIKQLDGLIQKIATVTGRLPNRLALGLSSWIILRNNAKVLGRFPGAAAVGVTKQQFAGLLANPQIEIEIGVLSQVDAGLNEAAAPQKKRNILGGDVFLFIAENSPTEFDPSFMKTFTTGAGSVDRVWTYEEPRAEILAVGWSEDVKVTSAICGKRLAVS